jgi:LacI family transcriptional regulator
MRNEAAVVGVQLMLHRSIGRRLLGGIIHYSRTHEPWRLIDLSWRQPDPKIFRAGARCGLLTFFGGASNKLKLAKGVPVVNLGSSAQSDGIPSVLIDNRGVGRAAAEYFLDRNFRNFAYLGFDVGMHAELRLEGFRERLGREGFQVSELRTSTSEGDGEEFARKKRPVAEWLLQLPKPVALFTTNDDLAERAIDIALENDLVVPDQVAVLGVDDDEVVCEMATVPISSVSLRLKSQGFKAASLLDHLMHGGKPPAEPILLPPGPVQTRLSTDILANADAILIKATSFIHQNIHRPLTVKDVVDHTGASRRYIERRFREVLNRTPYDEITRLRLRRACNFMAETDMTLSEIADACGFNETKALAAAIKRVHGMPPSQLQKILRAGQ